MALPRTWKSKSDIPEALQPLVEAGYITQADNGTWELDDVEGLVPKSRVDDFRESNITLKTQLEAVEKKLAGAVSAADAEALRGQIADLQSRIDVGEDDKRVQELFDKNLVTVDLGDGKSIRVDKRSRAVLGAHLKSLGDDSAAQGEALTTVRTELASERIGGGARAAMAAIGGFKDKAQDDVVRYVESIFEMGDDDFQPFMPDPDADLVDGKPQPLLDEKGKPIRIESHLRSVVEGGTKNGVWLDEPSGPGKRGVPRRPGGGENAALHGRDRIEKALADKQNAAELLAFRKYRARLRLGLQTGDSSDYSDAHRTQKEGP